MHKRLDLTQASIATLALTIGLALIALGGQNITRAAPASGPLMQGTGVISGHVYENDGSTPIDNLFVYATDYDSDEWLAETNTGPDGSYTLGELHSGDYRVRACAVCSGLAYVDEYYQETDKHSLAARVSVVEPGTTSGIDFTLDPGGIVSGRVTDEGGSPIESIHIHAVRVSDNQWFDGPHTNSEGYYTFAGVPPTDVYIYACSSCTDSPYLDEYYNDTLTQDDATVLSVSVGLTTSDIDFVLALGGVISGRVYQEDGVTPIADAYVQADDYDSGEGMRGANTQADGSYTLQGLASGNYRVHGNASGYVRGFYDGTEDHDSATAVVVAAPGAVTGVDFSLRQAGFITGRVTDEGGNPITNLHLGAIRVSDGEWFEGTDTDGDGYYVFDTLPPGDVYVQACPSCRGHPYINEYYDDAPTQDEAAVLNVAVGSPITGINFVLAEGGVISGHVYEADGVTPIANANVHASDYDSDRWGRGANTQADGSYVIWGLPSGDYRVSSDAPGYQGEYYDQVEWHHLADRVTVSAPGTVAGIDFSLAQGGTIRGRVTDEGGAPIANLHIGVIRASDNEWFGGPNSDDDGYYVFDAVPTGDVYVQACGGCNDLPYIDKYYDDAPTQETATVLNISAGGTISDVNFSMATGGVISGYVYQADGVTPIANAYVQADDYDGGPGGRGANTQADGSYIIRGLPSGDYRVRAEADGFFQEYYRETLEHNWAERVTVSAPNTTSGINFTLQQGNATIRGRVLYQDGSPVPHIGVYTNRWNGRESVWVQTDASGAYTMPVSAGTWVLEANRWAAQADDHTLQSTPLVPVGSGATVNDVDLILLPNDAAVAGTVREQDSTPIPSAQIVFVDETTGWYLGREVQSDANGDYSLPAPAGTWRINAWHQDYLSPPQQQVTVSAGETLHKDLYLNASRATISGRVLDQYNDPVPNANIGGWSPKLEGGGVGANADASGTYTLSVYAGVWHLDANYSPRYTSLPGRTVMVTETQYLAGIDLNLNKATAVVEGTVRLGSYDGPIINLQADTRVESQERGEWTHHQTIQNSGYYTSGVTAGTWDVYVHLEGYTCKESRPITITDGETLSVDLVLLTNTAVISGFITDQYGFPVPNADMSVQDPVSGRDVVPWGMGWADSTGRYSIGVAAGYWRVCVWRDGYDGPPCPEINVVAGEERSLNFVLQSRTSAIDGLVTDLNPDPNDNAPLAGANVFLWDQYGIAPVSDNAGPVMGDTTGGDGRFGFSLQVSSGPYLVRAFKEGHAYGESLIYALGGRHPAGTLRLPTQTGGAIAGQVSSGGSPMGNAVVVVRQVGSQSSALTQDGALARTTTDASGNYSFDAFFAPGDYTVVASAIGYAEATTTATVVPNSAVVPGDLELTPASVPGYGIAYLTTNVTTTMEQEHEYPALLQVRNVGSETWSSSGNEPLEFYHVWRDDQGNRIREWTLSWLPYDVPPGEVVFLPISLWSPWWAGEFTLEWGLWQAGDWLGETQTFNVSVTIPAQPNLHISEMDVSTDPPSVREGRGFDLLVFVHNDSNVDAYNVDVDLYIGDQPFGAGRYTLQTVPRHGTVVLRASSYETLSQSLQLLTARVDPDDNVAESSETDNNVTRIIRILPPSSDPIAPNGVITVNAGASTANVIQAQLSLSAEDNPGGTGVQQMYVTEFVFDSAAGRWQIVRESGWISYTTSLPWTLSPSGGVKHFQARFADGVQNVSPAALAWINYTPACDAIALAEWKLYQWQLSPGDVLTATVTPCGGQGDPDLYAWIGASGGSPHYYSSNAGVAPDAITLTASESNTYNFWVYGFEATSFDFTLVQGTGGPGTIIIGQGAGARTSAEGKSLPIAPPSTIETPTYVPDSPMIQIFIPLFVY